MAAACSSATVPAVCDDGTLDEEFLTDIESGGGSDFDSAGSLEALADATDGVVFGTILAWSDLRWGKDPLEDWWGVLTIEVDGGTVEADELDVIHLTANVRDRDRFGDGVGLRVVAFVDEPADDGFSPSQELGAWWASIEGLAIACDDTEPVARVEAPLPIGDGEPSDPSIDDLREYLAEV